MKGKNKKECDFVATNCLSMQNTTEQKKSKVEKPLNTGGKNPAAVALGRLGGLKGGKARAEKLTSEQRKEIAKKAAQARWAKLG